MPSSCNAVAAVSYGTLDTLATRDNPGVPGKMFASIREAASVEQRQRRRDPKAERTCGHTWTDEGSDGPRASDERIRRAWRRPRTCPHRKRLDANLT